MALIGSKGGWKLSTIFMLKRLVNNKITGKCSYLLDGYIFKLSTISMLKRLVNNKITGKCSYLLDGYIFAALFETAYHCFC